MAYFAVKPWFSEDARAQRKSFVVIWLNTVHLQFVQRTSFLCETGTQP